MTFGTVTSDAQLVREYSDDHPPVRSSRSDQRAISRTPLQTMLRWIGNVLIGLIPAALILVIAGATLASLLISDFDF